MKISYKWLKEYIDLAISPEELQERLTFSGIEVEAVEYKGKELKNIIAAKVVSKQKHPDADKLAVCSVDTGNEILQVVCGAPNCQEGMMAAFAPVGTQFGDFKIKKAKIRGVASFGMLCSEKELGISENHDGIIHLDNDCAIGTSVAKILDCEDTVYDVEITPNRPDLLGMVGVARDLSALLNLDCNLPPVKNFAGKEKITDKLSLENLDAQKCPRYTARFIAGVQVKESPDWLKQKLLAVGLRPINNIVDITNYVLMETGHPLHAFDYDKIDGQKIIIRSAEEGEILPALDGNEYKLIADDLIIADTKKPIALAGVIGGANSEITEGTTNIVIEAANFKYSTVRRTSGRYKIFTDSSYRFERGMSDENVLLAGSRAAELILQIAGGIIADGYWDSYPKPLPEVNVKISGEKTRKFLYADIPNKKIEEFLLALGLKTKAINGDIMEFTVPHFRGDLTREIDLVEEIIRLHGYNNVPVKTKVQNIMDRRFFDLRRNLKPAMVNNGFFEVINWPFADPEALDKLNIAPGDKRREAAVLKNPIGVRYSIMQTTLVPNLLKNCLFNINHGQKDIRLFELTKVFNRKDQKLADEHYRLTALLTGNRAKMHWQQKPELLDFFDIKGIAEDILETLRINNVEFLVSDEPFLEAGQSAKLVYKKQLLGNIGKLDAKVAKRFDVDEDVYLIDFDVNTLNKVFGYYPNDYIDIPKFPPVFRDISFVVSKNHSVEEITAEIKKINPIIGSVELFDEFCGKSIKEGFRSLSFKMIFVSQNKTLTDKYIDKLFNKIVLGLTKKFKIEMR